MTHPQLKVQQRKLLGKKVKRLRRAGIIPANIYGKKIKSQAIQLAAADFRRIHRQIGETNIVDLIINGNKNARHSLIRNLQVHPVTGKVLHVDFLQVNLQEKIETTVPIRLKGESAAVKNKQALLLQELSELEIEAEADKLPEAIIVDRQRLKAIGDDIRVKDLQLPSGIKVKTDPEQVIVRLDKLVAQAAEKLEEKEQEQATEAAEKAAAAAPADQSKPAPPSENRESE